ncbi:hypothetical protein OUZ56_032244 [Daphnia magna]|uniref:Uncharacterized protein n=1 Tax=Daphnia magna TaxID=35525 RepID=A0ABQ9ZWK2_9CRUS|nr:hypothetical protein OUZ56_032244 [Daphnia magna]
MLYTLQKLGEQIRDEQTILIPITNKLSRQLHMKYVAGLFYERSLPKQKNISYNIIDVQSGKYFLVDLTTATDPYVATVPDFWVNDGTQCWYPRTLGERASVKHSYEASRAKENIAALI